MLREQVPHPCMEEYLSYRDEYIDQMEKFIPGRDMEKIKKDPKDMKIVEEMEEYPLMEQVQPLCMENPELEYEEVELSISVEDDYISPCSLEDTNHLNDENFKGEIVGASFNNPPSSNTHIYKDELCEMLEPISLFLTIM